MANVTINVPDDLLREVGQLAADEGLSLSRFVARCLEQRLDSARRYQAARERSVRIVEQGFNLGIPERVSLTRDELHER